MGTTTTTNPAPTDYSPAMMMASSNQMITALGTQGVQMFGVMEASANRSEITMAHLELGLERIDAGLQESQLAHDLARRGEANRHEETMAALEGGGGTTVETSDFTV